ncbi:MAG: RDD family protein [Alphaproteobacteria bacterium]|nr:RDD family protein [Alphaproteobacteria bacterium]
MTAPLLDTLRTIETPEGVPLTVRVAGPIPRALAWILDLFIRTFLFYSVVGSLLGLLGEAGNGLMLLFVFAMEWFYPVLFEVLWHGQTPGKRVLSLAVVHDDGTPVGWSASVLRNLARAADFLPFAYLAGILSMVIQRDFQRLGDMAAGTLVVHRAELRRPSMPIQEPRRAPGVPLRREEQRAIIDFADRQHQWSHERRIELAELLEPLTGARGEEGVRRLLGVARWLRGDT